MGSTFNLQISTLDNIQKAKDLIAIYRDTMTSGRNSLFSRDAQGAFRMVAYNTGLTDRVSRQGTWNTFGAVRVLQSRLSAITQGGTTHIGSASYFLGRANPATEAVRENRFTFGHVPTVQQLSEYTNGQIIHAPVDVVLSWGSHPSDLDSHLTGPTTVGDTRFHVYFGARGSLNDAPNALLYTDYTDHGRGRNNLPEQTRIDVAQPGVYRFYVHDYSNRGATNSTALSNSGATVTVHAAGSRGLPEAQNLGREVARVEVPTNRVGTVWHAFELDSRTGVLNRVDQFRNVAVPAAVPFNN